MIRLGLLGERIAYSRSPALHQAAFVAAGLAGSYELVPCPPESATATIAACRAAGFRGLNVTVPHKQRALAQCDALRPAAAQTGAVNTLVFAPDGTTTGDNTDVAGFLAGLPTELELSGRTALVLGAGGAARAVVAALRTTPLGRIVVTARRLEQAQSLGAEAVPWTESALAPLCPALVVNATPAGTNAERSSSRWSEACALFGALPFGSWDRPFAYDLVYVPAITPFLAIAVAAGCPTQGGRAMLVHQAVLAFEAFTGVPASMVVGAMDRAFAESLP